MSEHYDFHYQPTGSGAISGQQVLEQTEDAINELGDYVYNNVGGAMDVAQQALETAQNAEQDAQTALDTANSFSSAIQSAQQDASTALSTAQTAQTTASNANNTAIQAQQDASSAVTTANNASGQVSTLSGTVTTLGQRVTTAEGNIGQNTSDITALTTRVGTAEGNITTLQNDVSIAQGNASSAMATAGTVKQQAYVFRYSSTALTPSSTNSNTLLDNTDNLKVGDKVIDSSGVLFSITAIDTQNSTFTIGTALIDLAQDSDVVHKSGDETVGGKKTFTSILTASRNITNGEIILQNASYDPKTNGQGGVSTKSFSINFVTALSDTFGAVSCYGVNDRTILRFTSRYFVDSQTVTEDSVEYNVYGDGSRSFKPRSNNNTMLGESTRKWKEVYATNYYYGSNNVEFSTKFVTTDTNQTISGNKTFSSNAYIYNSDNTANTPSIFLRNSKVTKGGSDTGNQSIFFTDKDSNTLSRIFTNNPSDGKTSLNLRVSTLDSNNTDVSAEVSLFAAKNGTKTLQSVVDNDVNLGNSTYKWKDVNTYLVNGLEPSSLSLPSGNASDVIDISSYISDLSGNVNNYTAPANGWISIAVVGTAIDIVSSSWSDSRLRASSGNVRMLYPVLKNETLDISVIGTTLAYARFIPCQGNV